MWPKGSFQSKNSKHLDDLGQNIVSASIAVKVGKVVFYKFYLSRIRAKTPNYGAEW